MHTRANAVICIFLQFCKCCKGLPAGQHLERNPEYPGNLGDLCSSNSDCSVPHSLCILSPTKFQAFCECEETFKATKGECILNTDWLTPEEATNVARQKSTNKPLPRHPAPVKSSSVQILAADDVSSIFPKENGFYYESFIQEELPLTMDHSKRLASNITQMVMNKLIADGTALAALEENRQANKHLSSLYARRFRPVYSMSSINPVETLTATDTFRPLEPDEFPEDNSSEFLELYPDDSTMPMDPARYGMLYELQLLKSKHVSDIANTLKDQQGYGSAVDGVSSEGHNYLPRASFVTGSPSSAAADTVAQTTASIGCTCNGAATREAYTFAQTTRPSLTSANAPGYRSMEDASETKSSTRRLQTKRGTTTTMQPKMPAEDETQPPLLIGLLNLDSLKEIVKNVIDERLQQEQEATTSALTSKPKTKLTAAELQKLALEQTMETIQRQISLKQFLKSNRRKQQESESSTRSIFVASDLAGESAGEITTTISPFAGVTFIFNSRKS